MKKETITVTTGKYGKIEIEAEVIVPGLAVHHALHEDMSFADSWWTLTHIRSGYALGNGKRTKREIMALAQKLSELGDWDKPRSKVDKSMLRQTKTIVRSNP